MVVRSVPYPRTHFQRKTFAIVALVVPSLPGSFGLPNGGAIAIAKLVILFYAIEVFVSRTEMQAAWLHFAAEMLLAGLIVRPLL